MATITVSAGQNLQSVLDGLASNADHELILDPAKFIGNFRLRNLGTGKVLIRSANLAGLPADGVRVTATNDPAMPQLLSPGGYPVIETDEGAGNYRFLGIKASVDYEGGGHGASFLMNFANGNDSNPNYGQWLAHDITFDRCHVAGKFGDSRFAIACAGERLTVTNSIIDEFANPPGNDSCGIWFSNAGGHRVENSLISAGMWCFDFGGADSDSPNRATIIRASSTSSDLTGFIGARPAIGDLVSFLVWLRPEDAGTWKPIIPNWQPNTTYKQYDTLWAGQDFLGRSRFFYVLQAGTTGGTAPNWNATSEYHGEDTLTDGSLVWKYFNGQYMVGKVTGITGDTVQYTSEGPTGIVLPPIQGSVARWRGYNPGGVFRRNHILRPKEWARYDAPNKGMVQIKNAKDAVFEGNFWDVEDTAGMGLTADQEERHRPGLFALTPGNQAYSAPWSTAQSIIFRYNRARHIESVFNWALTDYTKTSTPGGNNVAHDNLFEDVLHGFVVQCNGGSGVVIKHNTVINQSQQPLKLFDSKISGLTFQDNIAGWYQGPYLQWGDLFTQNVDGGAEGGNVFIDVYNRSGEGYPPEKYFPNSGHAMTWAEVKIQSDGRLAADSPFKNKGTDGKDPGADISLIEQVIGGVYVPPPVIEPPPPATQPTLRKVPWPTTEGGQNTVVAEQWKDRYRFKRNLTGKFAEFELVP